MDRTWAAPENASRVREVNQGSDEWLLARCGSIGASSISDLLATSRSGEAASRANLRARLVVERLTGRPAETYSNAAMEWGITTEPEARAAYEAETGALVSEVGLVAHPAIPWSHASPDGLVGDDGLLEIKCPKSATHLATLTARKAPARHIPQMLWQMACTGRTWCDFASYDPRMPEHLRLFVVRAHRDEDRIAHMEAEVRKLLEEVEEMIQELSK